MRHLKSLCQYTESINLDDFEDDDIEGTLGKNNKIYTSLYDYHMNLGGKRRRENAVGWLQPGSQKRNFSYVLPHLENGDSILDFGCGIGDLLPHISKKLDKFNYVGVDINPKFIRDAKKKHSGFDFYTIEDPKQITERFDKIVGVGVFTWYISKEDFVKTIRHLYSKCKKKLIITCIHTERASHSWESTYRGYNEEIFLDLFPGMNIEFEKKRDFMNADLVVVFNKN